MQELDRRTFLKLVGLGVVGSLALETGLYPVKQKAYELVEEHTDFQAGNAGGREAFEEKCGGSLNQAQCVLDQIEEDKVVATLWAPMIEEALLRSLPSNILNALTNNINPMQEEKSLSKYLASITKTEGIVGLLTAVTFAGLHNLTSRGFDTRTIPISQFIAGLEYWYLQRKFGYFSSFLAHSYHNSRIYFFKK